MYNRCDSRMSGYACSLVTIRVIPSPSTQEPLGTLVKAKMPADIFWGSDQLM